MNNDIGIDYSGPFPLYQRNQRTRQYVCIFTCFKTRAVHFKVVEDITTDSCLLAIRRFTSRRGKATSITSDNASAFHAAAKTLDLGKIEQLGSQQIDWTFIPLGTPHQGGGSVYVNSMSARIYTNQFRCWGCSMFFDLVAIHWVSKRDFAFS